MPFWAFKFWINFLNADPCFLAIGCTIVSTLAWGSSWASSNLCWCFKNCSNFHRMCCWSCFGLRPWTDAQRGEPMLVLPYLPCWSPSSHACCRVWKPLGSTRALSRRFNLNRALICWSSCFKIRAHLYFNCLAPWAAVTPHAMLRASGSHRGRAVAADHWPQATLCARLLPRGLA
jgi:hypothetical protein